MPAESGASCAFAASIKRAAALREGPLPFAVPVAVNLRRTRLRMPVPEKALKKVSAIHVRSLDCSSPRGGSVVDCLKTQRVHT